MCSSGRNLSIAGIGAPLRSLIQGARQRKFFSAIKHVSGWLLADDERETANADSRRAMPYLLGIRNRTSRLVLRTASETLSPAARARVLG